MRKSRLYQFVGYLLSPVWSWFFADDVRGLENMPLQGPFVLATNHISQLDPLMLAQLTWRRKPVTQLRFLAKEELFRKAPLKWIMNAAGQIPVARGKLSAANALVHAEEALRNGEALVIFPEGTISLTYVPMRPYPGVGRLAVDSGAPIVPVGIWGTHRTMTTHRRREIRRHRPVTIDIGPARTYTPADGRSDAVARLVMDDIVKLVDAARARYPERPAPGDWWGPPEWPLEKAGRWRPKIDQSMSPEEALETARRAMEGG